MGYKIAAFAFALGLILLMWGALGKCNGVAMAAGILMCAAMLGALFTILFLDKSK